MALEQEIGDVWDRHNLQSMAAGEMDENLVLFAAHVGAVVRVLAAAIDGLRHELIEVGIPLSPP